MTLLLLRVATDIDRRPVPPEWGNCRVCIERRENAGAGKTLFRYALWLLAFLDLQIVCLLGCLLFLVLVLVFLSAFVAH